MSYKKILLALPLLVILTSVEAETRYVTDQFKVMVRSGEGTKHKIVRMLPSGYSVDVLGANPETGYSEVRLKNGNTGYILTRQLMAEQSARDRIAVAEQRVEELSAEPGRLSSRLAEIQVENQKLQKSNGSLQSKNAQLEKELKSIKRTASNAVKIANERNELSTRVEGLEQQLSEVKFENQTLSNQSTQKWFMIGAGVTITGIIIGLILPNVRLGRRRKDSWVLSSNKVSIVVFI
ncbi:TIGR04211 family SH3 domain-containing protein [Candidatus Reidiella endopervernicosa]|uniref:TIGR04211 family SH3 domain-containing protein n=1 Tax=Candidatus Reidiella endopervernicosa TaxID=2738883 RepID=A0A6N0HX44_9GAMM|nr:TIGR04211 family SH3 domain-containing protein [Candidatus Reidiella endopervernicosa]